MWRTCYFRKRVDLYSLKARNIYNAVNKYFPCLCPAVANLPLLNTSAVCKLHKIIMDGLIDQPGVFRTRGAAPFSDILHRYLQPQCIESELNQLCLDVTSKLDTATDLTERIKISTSFFTSFLYIHPFKNGNGRLARILLSSLLCDGTTIPIMIYNSRSKREIFLDCLQDSRYNMDSTMLFEFILNSVKESYQFLSYMLELWMITWNF